MTTMTMMLMMMQSDARLAEDEYDVHDDSAARQSTQTTPEQNSKHNKNKQQQRALEITRDPRLRRNAPWVSPPLGQRLADGAPTSLRCPASRLTQDAQGHIEQSRRTRFGSSTSWAALCHAFSTLCAHCGVHCCQPCFPRPWLCPTPGLDATTEICAATWPTGHPKHRETSTK